MPAFTAKDLEEPYARLIEQTKSLIDDMGKISDTSGNLANIFANDQDTNLNDAWSKHQNIFTSISETADSLMNELNNDVNQYITKTVQVENDIESRVQKSTGVLDEQANVLDSLRSSGS